MLATDKVFAGSIPEIYDNVLVPLIFEVYAADMAGRVTEKPVHDVLETAAGSGVVTRALAPLLAGDARYVVTDLNPPMLERARARQGDDPRLTWQPADALDLPFPDASFDAVCCQFGVMFFPDRIKGYAEARRVLRPGGRFIFNVWDDIGQNAFADVVTRVAATLLPDAPPRFLARTPHGHGNPRLIRTELAQAGFAHVSVEQITATSTAADPAIPAMAYCRGTPMYGELAPHGEAMVQRVVDAATEEIRALYGDGPVSAPISGFVVTAW